MDDRTRTRRRARGNSRERRHARESERQTRGGARAFLKNLRNPYRPIEVVTADRVEAIHRAALEVLRDIGLRVLCAEARDLYAGAGATIDGDGVTVRFDSQQVEDLVSRAPSRIRMHARNPDNDLEFGEDRVVFLTVGGPPHASDMDRGRRAGDLESLRDFVRLTQAFDVVHALGAPVEPVDVPLNLRQLAIAHLNLTESDKISFTYSRGRQSVEDSIEMVRIARGIDADRLAREPSLYTVVNMNSPLVLDDLMGQGIIDVARAGQVVVITPFTLAGAMAPVTIAGALAQQHAEALAGIALVQIARPGAPAVYGGFTSNVDMRSGAPAFGTPEYAQAALIGGQLARRIGVPYRSSNTNASNAPDAQSAYESQMSLWGALMGGCNFLLHGAGWLEGGLSASYEKFILDVEMLQMMAAFFQPPVVDDDTLGIDAMREVGAGGHFFGAAHTLARYDSAFYEPLVSDWRNFETWRDTGSVDATQRAYRIWKEILARAEPPPMDAAIREELDAFVARRTEEGGVDVG